MPGGSGVSGQQIFIVSSKNGQLTLLPGSALATNIHNNVSHQASTPDLTTVALNANKSSSVNTQLTNLVSRPVNVLPASPVNANNGERPITHLPANPVNENELVSRASKTTVVDVNKHLSEISVVQDSTKSSTEGEY